VEAAPAIEPFAIAVDEAVLSDLCDRIRRTRWPDSMAGAGWAYGADPEYLRALLQTWAEDFDWREQERALNRLGHYRADIDGVRVHFVHERGSGPAPLPIVLTHGFPSSFVEHLDLLPLLTDPAAHGGDPEDAFHVVVASPPGYGFSDAPARPMLEAMVGDMWCRLMRDGLGYERFGAHGSDVGTGATIQLGLRHPAHVAGIHLSAFYLEPPPEPWSPAVRAFVETSARERAGDVAYSRMQSTKPQTVAYGLTDSPAGLAAWIVDLFRAFSDCGGDLESRFTRELLLTNLTLYWVTAAIGPAMRGYYDYAHFETAPPPGTRVEVPSGFAVFADSHRPGTARPPRELAEHGFNVARWTRMPRGGHFAALEEPELLAEEIRAFFRPLRRAT
jgi:pimeloyl-ACP methyl ester carboxylesterase